MLNREKNRQRRIIRQTLRGWYGSEFTEREMAAYPGDGTRISNLVDGLISKMASGDALLILELKEKWGDVAGAQIAKISRPVSIKNNSLCVEVDHNMWLRELMGPTKDLLIKNINKFFGEDFCRDIWFMPQGGSPLADSSKWKKRKKT